MLPIIGFIVVFASCVGGFMLAGGNPLLLWQPVEVIIILGIALGALFIGFPSKKLLQLLKDVSKIFTGTKYKTKDYLDMLVFLAAFLKTVKTKGFLAVEGHIENPKESELFLKFPKFIFDELLLNFTQEYLRAISMGVENPHHLDEIITEEINQLSNHYLKTSSKVLQSLADSLPALGIVAAVLGVIVAMASISEPPEVLGYLIGAALVGTFLGVFVSYGIFGPMGGHLANINESDMHMYKCIHQVLSCFLHGYPPSISVEMGRKTLPTSYRPSFADLENAITSSSTSSSQRSDEAVE